MNDKVLELLTKLADKFGTTVDHLWGVLIRQAGLSAASDALVALLFIAVTIYCARFVQAKTRCPAPTETRMYPVAEWSDEVGVGMAWAAVCSFAFVSMLLICLACNSVITALWNPEYWALKQVFK